ncbi:hypothetical protein ACFOET_01295 [Parapedobacter deserti]|uniref:DUF3196 domain-containing protein n=1 Tax=Parapedobacter deserti TaxID=1912957 RepID=A0ABV7JIZ0_9SPHI
MMDHHVYSALEAAIKTYGEKSGNSVDSLLARVLRVLESDDAFLEKVSQLDEAVDDYPAFEELREVIFDLLLINFFAADVKKLESDYLESAEWEDIEEQTIDRGTEILNLLLYLRECVDEEIEPQLEDYLKEFLLVDEDEFQDEYRIYEPIIANQLLVDSSYREIAEVSTKIPESQELSELFYPIMGFFYEQRPTAEDLNEYVRYSKKKALDLSVYNLLVAYNHSL